jgi:hypothetical protein
VFSNSWLSTCTVHPSLYYIRSLMLHVDITLNRAATQHKTQKHKQASLHTSNQSTTKQSSNMWAFNQHRAINHGFNFTSMVFNHMSICIQSHNKHSNHTISIQSHNEHLITQQAFNYTTSIQSHNEHSHKYSITQVFNHTNIHSITQTFIIT